MAEQKNEMVDPATSTNIDPAGGPASEGVVGGAAGADVANASPVPADAVGMSADAGAAADGGTVGSGAVADGAADGSTDGLGGGAADGAVGGGSAGANRVGAGSVGTGSVDHAAQGGSAVGGGSTVDGGAATGAVGDQAGVATAGTTAHVADGVDSAGNSSATTTAAGDASRRYLRPTRSTNIFNSMVAFITRRGVSILGSRVLYVRGRKSGEWRSLPVNLLTLDGQRYLVSPRGHSQWVRNLRAAGHGELRVGRRVERFVPTELADDDKPAILRAYLRRWKFEVGVFFDGVDANASDEVLRRIAPGYPVFRITSAP